MTNVADVITGMSGHIDERGLIRLIVSVPEAVWILMVHPHQHASALLPHTLGSHLVRFEPIAVFPLQFFLYRNDANRRNVEERGTQVGGQRMGDLQGSLPTFSGKDQTFERRQMSTSHQINHRSALTYGPVVSKSFYVAILNPDFDSYRLR